MYSNTFVDTVSAVTTYTKSTNNYLSSLTSSVVSIPFSATTSNYYVAVANHITSIGLKATTQDSKATVNITGDSNFVVGSNKITVKVTAESGSIRYYYVYVTRNAVPKSSNNNLATLSSDVLTIPFHKDTTTYEVTVSNLFRSLNLMATVEDSKATYVINGDGEFKVGLNTVTVVVTAESGSAKTYTIQVTREASSNNNLSSLSIEGLSISPEFSRDTLEYTAILKDQEVTGLNVSYMVEDATAIATLSGNTNIMVGDNLIKVVVKAESGAEKTYTITVTKEKQSLILPIVGGATAVVAIGGVVTMIVLRKRKISPIV